MNFWLVKQEPSKYCWEQFIHDKKTYWDGVRNYQARNNLKDMTKGDYVYFYHSVTGKQIVGIAKVIRESYQDPTTDDKRWVVVDLMAEKTLINPVTLEAIKNHPQLSNIALIKQARLSVMPLSKLEFKTILVMSKTRLSDL